MQNIVVRSCLLVAFSASLAACDKPVDESSPVPHPAGEAVPGGTANAPTGAVAPPAKSEKGMMTASPGVADCGNGTDVKIAWDVSSKPEVANVDVWVGDASPDAVLFAAGGSNGEQSTGPWVKPGTLFVLRNQADKQEVDRITIAGPTCPPAPAK